MRIGKRERRGLLRPVYVRRIATIQRNNVLLDESCIKYDCRITLGFDLSLSMAQGENNARSKSMESSQGNGCMMRHE